jgi:hypothetical protein
MRRALGAAILAAAAAFAAAPASATQGLLCRPATGSGPVVDIASSAQIIGVGITERGVTRSSMHPNGAIAVRQSWFDAQRVWIDLWNPTTMADEGKLRLSYAGRGAGRHLAGTFVRAGRLYRLRCVES